MVTMGSMVTPQSIEAEFNALELRCTAWCEAWAQREHTPNASVGEVLSSIHLGEPLAGRLVERLKEGRFDIDNALSRLAATTAGAIARLTGDGDTQPLERRIHTLMSGLGKHEETFDTKLAELRPLVHRYLHLATALQRPAAP